MIGSSFETQYEVFIEDEWISFNDYITNYMDETVHNLFRKTLLRQHGYMSKKFRQ